MREGSLEITFEWLRRFRRGRFLGAVLTCWFSLWVLKFGEEISGEEENRERGLRAREGEAVRTGEDFES